MTSVHQNKQSKTNSEARAVFSAAPFSSVASPQNVAPRPIKQIMKTDLRVPRRQGQSVQSREPPRSAVTDGVLRENEQSAVEKRAYEDHARAQQFSGGHRRRADAGLVLCPEHVCKETGAHQGHASDLDASKLPPKQGKVAEQRRPCRGAIVV